MNRTLISCTLLGALSLSLVGCGSSGSSSSLGNSLTGSTRATVLLTDSFREDFAHVWATIYRVELVPQDGSAAVVLFDDPSGHQIDLKTLRDSAGERFSFLGSAAVPDGTYTGIGVTVGPTMQLFRAGTAVGDPLPVDSSIPTDDSGKPVLSLTFRNPKTLASGTTNLIVDFDLARFIVRNSKILPVVAEGALQGLNDFRRHNQGDYRGAISGLTGTAPDLTFTLTRRDGTTTTVTTTAATALYGTEALANGATAEVRGTLDPTSQVLVATNVEVKGGDARGPRSPRVAGAASNLDTGAGTFTVTVDRACSLTPTETTVDVVTSDTTVFRTDDGSTVAKADFFTALNLTLSVAVEGTYDAASSTFTAAAVKIVDATQDGGWHRGGNNFRRGSDPSGWGHGIVHKPRKD